MEVDFKSSNISALVNKLNTYTKSIEDKVKINRILNEVDKRANQEFKNLLKISNKKYKSVKSGNSIQPALKEKNKLLEKIIVRISDDPVFIKEDYTQEKNDIQNNFLM